MQKDLVLIMAHPFFQPTYFRLLGIDPGSTAMGLALFDLDLKNQKIVGIQAWTIKTDKLKNDTGLPEELYADRQIRLHKLYLAMKRLLTQEHVNHVAYEGPFMNRLQPSAYGPLVALMTMVHLAVMETASGMGFSVFQPQQVKKSFGVAGKKGKEVMLEALSLNDDLMSAMAFSNCLLNELDEHSVDAIAAGYTAIKNEFFI